MNNMEDKEILTLKGLNQYRKIHLLDRKYGRPVIEESERRGSAYYFRGLKVVNLQSRSIMKIRVFTIEEDVLTIEGEERLAVIREPYCIYVSDSRGGRYAAETGPCPQAALRGDDGELILPGSSFRARVPLRGSTVLSICASIGGDDIELDPDFDSYMGLNRKHSSSFIVRDGWLVTNEGRGIRLEKAGLLNEKLAERKYEKELGGEEAAARRAEYEFIRELGKSALQDRVAFISIRADDRLLDNMRKVYDALDLPKIAYSKFRLALKPDCLKEAKRIAASSRIVITDDYLTVMRDLKKKPGQKYIQLWHAAGAAKKFGLDGTTIFPAKDALYHRQYDLVTVSSEEVRKYYAGAFDISEDVVAATGVAKTDDYFDREWIESAAAEARAKHPELAGKEVILYAPTFRDLPGVPREKFEPEIDFGELSVALGDDRIFVICPHPVMTEQILQEQYDNIVEIRDVSTKDMMAVSDMMITDYSSVFFEYVLLDKPVAFYCPDYDTYDRDFYMDFDTELPGPMLRTMGELAAYISGADRKPDLRHENFRSRYMGACDGHSTERIVRYIEDMFHSKK